MNTTPLTIKALSNNVTILLQRIGKPLLLNLQIHRFNNENTIGIIVPDLLSGNYKFGIQNENKIILQKGQFITIKGSQATFSSSLQDYYRFDIDGAAQVFGNVMSLVNSAFTINNPYQFYRLFEGCKTIESAPELPATTLTEACYLRMFENCVSLINPPVLPANKLANRCYKEMFKGCMNFTYIPKLNAKELLFKCYYGMFEGCIRLKTILFFALKLAPKACSFMFWNCVKIRSVRVYFRSWLSNGTLNWLSTKQIGSFYKFNSLTELYNESRIPRSFKVIDLNKEPLTFTAEEDKSSVTLIQAGKPNLIDLYYSINDGNWVKYIPGRKLILKEKDILQFKNNSPFFSIDDKNYYQFVMDGTIKASGMVESLINFRGLTAGCFTFLFKDCESLVKTPYMLYSTELANRCYEGMFAGCISIFEGPILPATVLADKCYREMFCNCRSLGKVMCLPATKLANECYTGMFHGCENLSEVPTNLLPAMKMAVECYRDMFAFCTSLINAPDLPSISLAHGCYQGMFQYCEELKTPPALPATKLADNCYMLMFYECWNMYNAPDLPATELTYNCYCGMFRGCSRLIFAPLLPAKKLVAGCYENMFEYCHSLGSLTAYFEHWDEKERNTWYWLEGVGDGGTFFHKDVLDTDATRDGSHIPPTWNTVSISIDERQPLTFTSIEEDVENPAKVTLRQYGCPEPINIKYALSSASSEAVTWQDYVLGTEIVLNNGLSVSFKNDNLTFSKDDKNYYYFDIDSGKTNANGSVNSLIGTDELKPYIFVKLFEHCTSLMKAPKLNSNILAPFCYKEMFANCDGLTNIPSLSNILTLAEGCFIRMFYDCKNIESVRMFEFTDAVMTPLACKEMFAHCEGISSVILPSKYLAPCCYQNMFTNCCKLLRVEVGFEYWYDRATMDWLLNTSPTGTFIKPILLKNDYSTSRIPERWESKVLNSLYTPLTFIARGLATMKLAQVGSPDCLLKQLFIKINYGNWMLYKVDQIIPLKKNDIIQFRNYLNQFSLDRNNYYQFEFNSNNMIEAYGNIMSLVNFSTKLEYLYIFAYLFAGCVNLVSAPLLPAMTLSPCCYYNMFNSCTHLTKAPLLPANQIEMKVYLQMFANCTALTSIPYFKVEEVKRCCFRGMFRNCTSLTSVLLHETHIQNGCYANMFNGCSNLSSVTVHFTNWDEGEEGNDNPPTTCWLANTVCNGTFNKPEDLSIICDINHIPPNWQVNNLV